MNPTTTNSATNMEESSYAGVVGNLSQGSPSLEGATASVTFPDFRSFKELQSLDARTIGRINAGKISEEEYERWEAERGTLITKEFSEGLSTKERNHLVYVQWNLARIEDAKFGATLDALDAAVSRYEEFADRIERLQEQLKEVTTQHHKETSTRYHK